MQLPERSLIGTDGKLCFHPHSDSERVNADLRTSCRMNPDTIRNGSVLVFWRKEAFLTIGDQNSTSHGLHLRLTCVCLGGSQVCIPAGLPRCQKSLCTSSAQGGWRRSLNAVACSYKTNAQAPLPLQAEPSEPLSSPRKAHSYQPHKPGW